jgi:hypothetical protein
MALKTSAVVGARGMVLLYSDMGICKAKTRWRGLAMVLTGPGRFELRLTSDTAPFHVAIHAPGFLQHFESDPFRLSDAKEGTLEILVPQPAGLDVHFDSAVNNTEDALFKVLFSRSGGAFPERRTPIYPLQPKIRPLRETSSD